MAEYLACLVSSTSAPPVICARLSKLMQQWMQNPWGVYACYLLLLTDLPSFGISLWGISA